jgi:uncharacterized integral membrane protein
MVMGRRLVGISVFVALLVGGWSFAYNHQAPVTIDYWLGEWVEVPLWVVLLCSFAAGAVSVGLWSGFGLARRGLEARRYRSALAGLEQEVHQLRNLPLAAESAATSAGADLEPAGRSERAAGAEGGGSHP